MKNQVDLRSLTQRLHRHFYLDGVVEGLAGLWLLMMSGYFLISLNIEGTLYFFYPLLLISLPLLLGPVTQAIKTHVTFPRIGYAKLPPPPAQGKRLRIAAILVGIGIILGLILDLFGTAQPGGAASNATGWLSLLPVLIGIAAAAGFFYTAVRHAITRFYLLGLFILLAAALSNSLTGEILPRLVIFMALAGSILLLSGLFTFISFLRRYPVDESEMEYHVS
jgi:hypothetical protein